MLTRLLHPHPSTDFIRIPDSLGFRMAFSWLVGVIGRRPFAMFKKNRPAPGLYFYAPPRRHNKLKHLARRWAGSSPARWLIALHMGNIREGPD